MRKTFFAKTPIATAAAATVLLGWTVDPLHAQTATAGDSTQEVTVTARKRSERAIDVPLSISVVTGSELQDRGAIRLSENPVPRS